MLDAAVHQDGLMMSGGNQTEESFWSFFQGFIYRGRVCWPFGGVSSGGTWRMLSRQVSECLRYAGKGWKDSGFSPFSNGKTITPHTQRVWAQSKTVQIRENDNNTSTNTHKHIRSHTVQIGFFVRSLDLAFALMAVFTLRYIQRDAEERMRQLDIQTRVRLHGHFSSYLIPHSLFITAPFLCSLVPSSSLSFLAIPFPTFPSFVISPSLFIEAHGRTLVHAHIGVTEKSACIALDVLGVQRVEFLWGHLQVGPYFWARGYLWDVKPVLTACHQKQRNNRVSDRKITKR